MTPPARVESFCYPRDAEKLEEQITLLKARLKAEEITGRACQHSLKLLTEIVDEQKDRIEQLEAQAITLSTENAQLKEDFRLAGWERDKSK